MRAGRALSVGCALWALTLGACGDDPTGVAVPPSAGPSASAVSSARVAEPELVLPKPAATPERALTGGVVARLDGTETVVIADEDHRALRILPDASADFTPESTLTVELPGAPAQVATWGGSVVVTVRDPGLVMLFRVDKSGLTEVARAKVPADAWGLAITKDGARAIVTSAWTHRVSGVDLAAMAKGGEHAALFSLDVAREPRGVTIDGDTAWVSHLVGADLTRIDGVSGAAPTQKPVRLAAAPLRAPSGKRVAAALGYALALSPDGSRLFVARHALGAMGREAWFGASTVDVLAPKTEDELSPMHQGNSMVYRSSTAKEIETPDTLANLPVEPLSPFTQPRDVRYREKARTLLVVGEGDNVLVELDALGLAPTIGILHTYRLGKDADPYLGVAGSCAAPSGVALSADQATAYVYCRASNDSVRVPLLADPALGGAPAAPAYVRLATDTLGDDVNKGRRIFYDATDKLTSGGLACAGCHPEGRDDGFVWREAKFDTPDGTNVNFVGGHENIPDIAGVKGVPRRTPMLVGRVGAEGPYGWRAENKTLAGRIEAGMGLHRWGGLPTHAPENRTARAGYVSQFLRQGLVAPPMDARPLDATEARGKAVFETETAGCAVCHRASTAFTDRVAYPLKALPTRAGFDDEASGTAFKTPSLLFLAGHPPYLHDGSVKTLEEVVANNQDRMGKTSHLSEEDRAALVAYLKTL